MEKNRVLVETVNKSGEASLQVVGDVNQVLQGAVDPQHVEQSSLDSYQYALGGARFSNPNFFGETIILQHTAFGTVIGEDGQLLTEQKEQTLDAPFLLSVEVKKEPSDLVQFQDLSVLEVFEELNQSFSLGFAFVADAVFGLFEGAYLKKSPVYNENVNVHHDEYWEHPGAQENVQAFLFGVCLTQEGQKQLPHIDKAFYHNPGESKGLILASHTHAALCEQHQLPKNYDQMKQLFLKTPIFGVRHCLSQSMFKEGMWAIFDLKK